MEAPPTPPTAAEVRPEGGEADEAADGDTDADADADAAYFVSYGDSEVQALMLRDEPRVAAFSAALASAAPGRTVLDVGCGTGLLSLLAARSGARRVYACEACPELASRLPAVFEANGFGGVVTVLACRLEDAELPEKVDVVVSEWLGFHLLHESMLDSVLLARDRWLKLGGQMLPCAATLYAAPVNLDGWLGERVGFWSRPVHGFDLRAFAELAAEQARSQPLVTCLAAGALVAPGAAVFSLDLANVTRLRVALPLGGRVALRAARSAAVHGYALWFKAAFPCGTVLSTGPEAAVTHWQQSVVLLPRALAAVGGESDLSCMLTLSRAEGNHRHCDISLEL